MRKFLLLFSMVLVVCGCESTMDCFSNRNTPKWEVKELPAGMRNQGYLQYIELDGGNDFSVQEFRVNGNFPPGLECTFDGASARISGTPNANGNFTFSLRVKVGYYNGEESISSCSRTIRQEYNIVVN